MSSKLGKIVADFRTSLATKISVGGTTASLQSNLDDDGIALPDGTYFFTIDGDSSQKEHIVATNTGGNLTDIKSISRQGVQTAGVKREHRVGAAVTITDFAHIKYLNDLLDGTTDLDGSKPLKYDIDPTISDDKHLATKKYVGDAFSGVVGTASSTVSGTTKLSSDPVTPNNPVALNSEEVSATSGANKVPKANANGLIDSGFIIDNAADSGLEEGANGGTKVKVKTAGGILIDADGLKADPEVVSTIQSMPAYENLVAGDLLKTINDGGTYKLGKILGIKSLTHSSITYSKAVLINSTTILFVAFASNDITGRVGIISGSTITFGSPVRLNTHGIHSSGLWAVERASDTKYVITYVWSGDGKTVHAQEGSISGNVITPNDSVLTLIGATGTNSSDNPLLKNIDTNKIACFYSRLVSGSKELSFHILDTTSTLVSGSRAVTHDGYADRTYSLTKLGVDKLAFGYCDNRNYAYNVLGITVSGTTPTIHSGFNIPGSSGDYVNSFYSCYYDTNSAVAVYKKSTTTTPVFIHISLDGSGNATSSKSTTITDAKVAPLIKVGNVIYNLGSTTQKILMGSTAFTLSLTKALNTGSSSSLLAEINGDIICGNGGTSTYKLLLDHDEFVTSANASYTAGDSVPLTDRFTGFSSLINGVDIILILAQQE